jgi:two-component system LytT family sensor kinase
MKKSVLVMFHLLFWIFSSLLIILGFQLLTLPATVLGGGGGPGTIENLTVLLIALPIGACIFYTSYFTLNFFLKRTSRFLWIALGYAIFIAFIIIDENYGITTGLANEPKRIDFLSILAVIIPVLYFNTFGFLFRTFIEWIKDRKIKAELEKDKIESQLELLKSKINPHFLFNTLNNIDILIKDEPEKASDYLKKLSEILRFMLYESNTESIPLTNELEYIKKYLGLQKIRTSNDDFVDLQIVGDSSDKYIAPMIFVHFIENAFKYATNKKIKNAVSVKFDISDKSVSFMCKNHISTCEAIAKGKNGIGMQLIKQRLDLIYKSDYTLNVVENNDWYTVTLEIKLAND